MNANYTMEMLLNKRLVLRSTFTVEDNTLEKGSIFKVLGLSGPGYSVAIKSDNWSHGGHDCGGLGSYEESNCWWVEYSWFINNCDFSIIETTRSIYEEVK